MALSTSELVADSRSASSVGGASGARLVFVPASGPDVGAWLVEARLAAPPDIVRRGLFVLKNSMDVNMPWQNNTRGTEGLLYLCAELSVRTSFLVTPRGPAAPRWLAAAGSASLLGNLP